MNANDCLSMKPRLAALACDDITPAEQSALDAHLGECAACRNELDGLRRTSALLRREFGHSISAPAGLRHRIVSVPRSAGVNRFRRAGLAAASVVALSMLSLAGLSAANTRVANGPGGWEVQFSLLPPEGRAISGQAPAPDPEELHRIVDQRVQEVLASALSAQQQELQARFERSIEDERRATLADVARTFARHEKILAAGLSGDRQEMMARDQAVERLVGSEINRTHQMLGAVLAASRPAVVEQ